MNRALPFAPGWRSAWPSLAMVFLALVLFAPFRAQAAPAAGTQIGNQASATYTDSGQASRTVTSNTVVTTVQQVAALTLTANGAKTVTPGGQARYAHTLTNTGNGNDAFSLAASQSGAFTLGNVAFYTDANGDGVADNATPITTTGTLAAGAIFRFVAMGTAPSTTTSGQANSLTVTATSGFNPGVSAANTDTTTISTNAVVNVTKVIDVARGTAGSGPRTFTLTYTNTGNLPATDLTLTDAIPSGMSYVAGSGRWSSTGGTALTDGNATDDEGGILYDYNVSAAGRITAVIKSVTPGTTGTLSFQVMVNAGLPPGANPATANTAGYRYNDGSGDVGPFTTNTAQFTVTQGAAVSMTGATVASVTQGGTASFANTLTNTGNGSDSFDIAIGTGSFPAGTTFALYRADGVTPMVDTNGNSIPDTGPLAPGASTTVVLKATLPPGATGGPYAVQKTAASAADPAQKATVTDTLTTIVGNSVDLTNNTSGAGSPGSGQGPEGSAVVSNAANPGATSRFTLYVANGSGVSDSFDLAASADQAFAAISLPAGWKVIFRDENGAVISNTGLVGTGQAKKVYADVSVPTGAAPGSTELYFRALSPTTGAGDRIHDAVAVATVRALTLTPNGSGQTYPGGTVIYSHTVANGGNVTEGDGSASQVTLTLADSAAGFSSSLYWDKNGNSVLDAGDPVVANLAALSGGSNGASTDAGLAPGEAATLFVKVYAAGSAAPGAMDSTTLTATTSGAINSVAAPAPAASQDATTVIAGQLNLTKTQALDAACDGAPDGDYAATALAARPGACVRYRVAAKNVGVANATSVVLSDGTPANSIYHGVVPATASQGSVSAPADGSGGTVQATVGTLAPGQEAVLIFGIRITP